MNRIEKPFTNEIGQTINVGDEVLVVTMNTKCLGINKGIYLGTTDTHRVQAKVQYMDTVRYDKATNQKVDIHKLYYEMSYSDWKKYIHEDCEIRKEVAYRTTTLINNKIYALR